jgi:hypothetical protein
MAWERDAACSRRLPTTEPPHIAAHHLASLGPAPLGGRRYGQGDGTARSRSERVAVAPGMTQATLRPRAGSA